MVVVTRGDVMPSDVTMNDDSSSDHGSPVSGVSIFHPRGYTSVPQDEVPRETTPLWSRVRASLASVVPNHRPVESQYHALEQGEEPMELETEPSSSDPDDLAPESD